MSVAENNIHYPTDGELFDSITTIILMRQEEVKKNLFAVFYGDLMPNRNSADNIGISRCLCII